MKHKYQVPVFLMAILMVFGLLMIAFNTPIASAAGTLETPTYVNPYNATATPSADGAIYHTVLEGQSPYVIAALYGIDVATLLENNDLGWDSVINIGDVLLIRNVNELLPGEVVATATPAVNTLTNGSQPAGGSGTADTVGSLGVGVNGTLPTGSLNLNASGTAQAGSLGDAANGALPGGEPASSVVGGVLGEEIPSGAVGTGLGGVPGSEASQNSGEAAGETNEEQLISEKDIKAMLELTYEQLRAYLIDHFSQTGVLVNLAGTPVAPDMAMTAALNGEAYIVLPEGEAGLRTATAISDQGVSVLTVGEQQSMAIPAIQAVALAPEAVKDAKSAELTPNLVERIFSNNTKYLALAVILMVLIGLLLLVISTRRLRE